MRREFPLLAMSDYSLCNEFCRGPKYRPLLTKTERETEKTKQDEETRTLEGYLPTRYRELSPLNNLDFFGDAYLTSSNEVIKLTGKSIAEKTKAISVQLEKRNLPALRVKEIFSFKCPAFKDSDYYVDGWAFVSDFHGSSLDWFVFDNYPEYTGDLSLNLRHLGEVIATFENANVALFDSHLSNYSSNGESVIRIDLESLRWPTMPLELLDWNEKQGVKDIRSLLRGRVKKHNSLLETICYIGNDLLKMEVLHNHDNYEFIAEDYLLAWGVHCKDTNYESQQSKLISELHRKYAGDISRGYNSKVRKPRQISADDLKYKPAEIKPVLEEVLKECGLLLLEKV
jgi:hypothetical protein